MPNILLLALCAIHTHLPTRHTYTHPTHINTHVHTHTHTPEKKKDEEATTQIYFHEAHTVLMGYREL